jgi:Fe-S-cluster-containing dehydrogenase component
MKSVLFIDLEKCRECPSCRVPCSYTLHEDNDGIGRLREIAEFTVTCRRCEDPPCVRGCPTGALERTGGGMIVRHGVLCVACKSCCFACPFGVILPELMRIQASECDLCAGRLKENEPPVCAGGCGQDAIRYGSCAPEPKSGRFSIGEGLIVRILPWKRETDS